MRFPDALPDTLDHEPSWAYFLCKAATGSCKASEMLVQTEAVIVHQATGVDHYAESSIAEYECCLSKLVPTEAPWKSFPDLLNQLVQDGYVNAAVRSTGEPLHDSTYYDSLWQRGVTVDEMELAHDAALRAFRAWSVMEYSQLRNTTEVESLEYNSRDVVAAMIMLLTAGSTSEDSA